VCGPAAEAPTLPAREATTQDPDVTRGPAAAPAAAEPLPTVPGYEVLQELDGGGMGVVYRARHLRLDLPVALKRIRSGSAASRHELARFHAEARAVAGLTHPGVVRLYDYGEHRGLPYFSMELVGDGSLADRLRHPGCGMPVPAPWSRR
jgi:serine/threonine-protein kinase